MEIDWLKRGVKKWRMFVKSPLVANYCVLIKYDRTAQRPFFMYLGCMSMGHVLEQYCLRVEESAGRQPEKRVKRHTMLQKYILRGALLHFPFKNGSFSFHYCPSRESTRVTTCEKRGRKCSRKKLAQQNSGRKFSWFPMLLLHGVVSGRNVRLNIGLEKCIFSYWEDILYFKSDNSDAFFHPGILIGMKVTVSETFQWNCWGVCQVRSFAKGANWGIGLATSHKFIGSVAMQRSLSLHVF